MAADAEDRCEADLREVGVEALAVLVDGVCDLFLATSDSNPAQAAMPSLLPSWFTANDSQWLARSAADRE